MNLTITVNVRWFQAMSHCLEKSGAPGTRTRRPGSSLRVIERSPFPRARAATSLTRPPPSTLAQATRKSLRRSTALPASPSSSPFSFPLASLALLAGTCTATGVASLARSVLGTTPRPPLTATSPGSSIPSSPCQPLRPWRPRSRSCSAASGERPRARTRELGRVTVAGSRAGRAGSQRGTALPGEEATTPWWTTTKASCWARTATMRPELTAWHPTCVAPSR